MKEKDSVQTYYVQLNKDNILAKISQEDIMKYYLGFEVSTTKSYVNPLRDDKNPGCKFWYGKGGKLYFNDFSSGFMWDCFAVVQYKYSISFWEALNKINIDLKLGLNGITSLEESREIKSNIKKVSKKKSIQSLPKPWTESALSYWKSYGISKETLERNFVYNTDLVYIDFNISMRSTEKNPIFTYLYPPSSHVKIYRPLSEDKTKKWKSTTSKNDIDGMYQLPKKGKLLIITSSRKDVMLLQEMKFSAISCTSESVLVPEKILKKLKKRFQRILVFMDSDNTGKIVSEKYATLYNLKYILIPDRFKSKDISDFRHKYKGKRTYQLLKKLIKTKYKC